MVDDNTKIFINPTGRFVIGGPHGDAGLTGRKIIVDTYGGVGRHGGGAFSGKDCTKVDRSAAYAARYVAKNLVAAGYADRLEIQLSYAIGVAQPTSINVNTFGTGRIDDEKIVEIIRRHFDLRPAGIIKMLDLRRPIYKQTAAYGCVKNTQDTSINACLLLLSGYINNQRKPSLLGDGFLTAVRQAAHFLILSASSLPSLRRSHRGLSSEAPA